MTHKTRPSADKTRHKILHAAKKVFLEKGYDGAFIKTIAQEAKVNANLIFHHFGDKENLWHLVKQSIVSVGYLKPQYDVSSARQFFSSLLDYRFELYGNHPELVRLLQWQELTKNESELIGNDINSPTHWLKTIKVFQKKGDIIKDIDAQQILLFVIFSTHAPFWQEIYPLDDKQCEHYKKMILTMCCQQFLKGGH